MLRHFHQRKTYEKRGMALLWMTLIPAVDNTARRDRFALFT